MNISSASDPKRIKDKNFVVVFSSLVHCSACRTLKQTIGRMPDNGINVFEIDVDKHFEVAARYHVIALPTILFFRNNKVRAMLTGAISEMHLYEAMEG